MSDIYAAKTNSEIAEEKDFEYPKEKFYLFTFIDRDPYEMRCGISFKDALWEMAKYTNNSSEMLCKCLKGYKEDDIEGMIELFNHFAYHDINKVYIIDEMVYAMDWSN